MRTRLPLSRGWNRRVKSAILHILALRHYAFTALAARATAHLNRYTAQRSRTRNSS